MATKADTLTIGQVAKKAGVGVETVRFYERQGLMPQPPRKASGYRQYPSDAVRRLRFIVRAKSVGFALKDIAELLDLRTRRGSTCRSVKRRTEAKIADVEARIRELQRVRSALARLSDSCDGSDVPLGGCPILDALEPEEEHDEA